MRRCVLIAAFALLGGARFASAHHAFAAEFDVNKPVKVNGIVTKMEFTNPHAWIYVDVKDPRHDDQLAFRARRTERAHQTRVENGYREAGHRGRNHGLSREGRRACRQWPLH